MENLEQLEEYVKKAIKEYPELKSSIMSLFQLCLDEIEEGGSRTHEIELCVNDIEENINESLNEAKENGNSRN